MGDRRESVRQEGEAEGEVVTYMNTVSAAAVYVPLFIDVDTVRDAIVDVCKDAPIEEGLCYRIHVELVAA